MLTEKEMDAIRALNRRNKYCLTAKQMATLAARHNRASKTGDVHEMEAVEYRLTHINFHYECGLLIQRDYDAVKEEIKKW